jgi:2',3'-cyclic-nucleotide 2'-phosphodiesterase (5'-nucleotidase family)
LRRTVDRLREIGPTILADAGDFAAAADLDIDVGVVGNHEFEWGIEHLRSHAPETGYPLLCANSPKSRLPRRLSSRRTLALLVSSP